MSEMPSIRIEFAAEGKALLERLRAMPEKIAPAIARGMDKAGIAALDEIKVERFRGKGPFPAAQHKLGEKTTDLRASLRYVPARIGGGMVTAAMGSNLIYFGVHEFGFTGQVHVSSFTRAISSAQFTKAGTGLKLNKKARSKRGAYGTETVRAFTRWMSMPAREPLGHGIADHAGDFTAAITAELRAVWNGGRP